MAKMMELSDNSSKTALIKLLQGATLNTYEK
jgi:hypothetical protein